MQKSITVEYLYVKLLAIPPFTRNHTHLIAAKQQPETVEKSVELELLSVQTGLSVRIYS